MHSKHCGVRNTFVDLLSSFQRPTDPFRLRTSNYDALSAGLLDPTERTRYLPPSKNPVKRRKIHLFNDPSLQGPRCLAEAFRAVKNARSTPLIPVEPRRGSGPI